MFKALFWIIAAACVAVYFPVVVFGVVVLVLIFFGGTFLATWTRDRKDMEKLEEERKQAEARRCELEATERRRAEERAQVAAERRERQKREESAKARAVEEAYRDRAERIAKYNRLAKEAAVEGDTETAECWRRLAVEELKKYQ